MSRLRPLLFVTGVALTLTASPVEAQHRPIAESEVPSRITLARLGLERHWLNVAPLGEPAEQILRISMGDGLLFVKTNMGHFHVYDAETGRWIWTADLGERLPYGWGASANSRAVFVASTTELFAFDRPTGRLLWRRGLEVRATSTQSVRPAATMPAGPTAADEQRVMVGLQSGRVLAFNVDDGRLAWVWQTSGPVVSRPVATSLMVAIGSLDGRVYVNRQDPPRPLYRFLTNGPVRAALGRHGTSTLLIASEDTNLYALNLFTAETLWAFPTGAPIVQEPLVANDDILVVNQEGILSSVDARNGQPLWTMDTGRGRLVAVSPSRVYLMSPHRDLIIVERETGQMLADARATHQRAGLNLREYTLDQTNSMNDRIYLASRSGLLLCLRETGQLEPAPLRDPNLPPFGTRPDDAATPPAAPTVPEPADRFDDEDVFDLDDDFDLDRDFPDDEMFDDDEPF